MKEKINAIVKEHCDSIRNSDKTFSSIFNVMFSLPDRVLAEKTDGYKIQKITYEEARNAIICKAQAFSLVLGEDNFVGLDMENSIEWIISFWAILMSGNKPLLINSRHPKSLTEKLINTLKIKHVVAMEKPTYQCEFVDYHIEGKNKITALFGDCIALTTSATTLNAKICLYTGKEISYQILNSQDICAMNKTIKKHYNGSIKLLAFLPMYHIFGLMATYFWFTLFGRTLVFLKDYSPDTILKTIKKHKVTHLLSVPLLWHTIENQVKKEVHLKGEKIEKKFYKGLRLSTKIQNIFPHLGKRIARRLFKEVNTNLFGDSVLFCISGGSYIKNSTLEMFNGLGYPIHNGYGMTEIGISSVELRYKPKSRNLNSIGKPFGSVEYKIMDRVLYVKGNTICKKMYIGEVLIENDEWFNTQDIAHVDDEGYYYIDGRLNDVIIGDNGENINPDILEKNFSIDYVKRFAIFGNKKGLNDKIAIVVEPYSYLTNVQFKKIYDSIREQNAKLPLTNQIQEFYYTKDSISSELAIKVSRQYLLRGINDKTITLIPFSEDYEVGNDEINEELVEKIKKIFQEATGIENIDINKHFIFDLGGTSLDYFAVVSKINAQFGVKLRLDEGNCCYTVREFALEIAKIL